jgi:hypothetical protein
LPQQQANLTAMHQAPPLPLLTQQGGAGYARGAAARAWLLRTLRPATCDVRTRIALLPMHHSGIGSSLLVWASYALLCVEHGYTVVPHGTWKFAKGLEPATHESFFEPLASPACTAEASRRVATAAASCTTRPPLKEHRRCVDGRATTRHVHGITERTARCDTVKVPAESADAVSR